LGAVLGLFLDLGGRLVELFRGHLGRLAGDLPSVLECLLTGLLDLV
jgi:hypothetical protein